MALAAEGAGSDVLFLSHDMILTRACVAELLALREAQSGQGFGVLRPRSGHMDFAAKMTLAPPTPVRDQHDAETFAAAVREQFGGQVAGWPALIGDAMFIRREAVEKVGGMDPRFYGYWADIDYGVRVQRAGWRHGIAAGAWLHHSGSASGLEDAPPPEEARRRHEEMISDSTAAYQRFRAKWGEALLPAEMSELDAPHLRALRAVPAGEGLDYHAPVRVADELVEEL
jgi:GT2 family glycosyltransferase